MHGLINRSIERFLRDNYGDAAWRDVADQLDLGGSGFQSFRHYPDRVTLRLLAAAVRRLGKPEAELLEDLGAWLARTEPTRRLLRFSGSDFTDFLLALAELPGRVAMVLPDLEMPRVEVVPRGAGQFRVALRSAAPEWRSVLAGVLRAMSDDYGALALIVDEGGEIMVDVSDVTFQEARGFDLGAGPVRAVMR